jgi:hypothetical protein
MEAELEKILWEIGKQRKKQLGRKLERILIKCLMEIQRKFPRVVLFDVEVKFAYGIARDYSYQVTLDRKGVETTWRGYQTIPRYVKSLSRYGENQFTNPADRQVILARRVKEIYDGKLRPMRIEHWID